MVTSNENILFSYEGQFKDDLREGKGVYRYSNGDM